MAKLWMRLGCFVELTAYEEAAIFCGDDDSATDALKRIVADGRFELDGDSYIPEEAIERFNASYGTDYCTEELGISV